MDYTPDSGENYYVPQPSKEYQEQQQQEKDLNAASIQVVLKFIEDLELELSKAKTIEGIEVGGGISTDAQLLAKEYIARWAESKLGAYRSKYQSFLESN